MKLVFPRIDITLAVALTGVAALFGYLPLTVGVIIATTMLTVARWRRAGKELRFMPQFGYIVGLWVGGGISTMLIHASTLLEDFGASLLLGAVGVSLLLLVASFLSGYVLRHLVPVQNPS